MNQSTTQPTYLINPDTFLNFEDLSCNVSGGRMQAFIGKAQNLDLKPFLGLPLYSSLVKHFVADEQGIAQLKPEAPEAYRTLWQGGEYTDAHGHAITYGGLLPALVYFAFARFAEGDAVRFTASGPVVKRSDHSEALPYKDVLRITTEYRSIANAYCNEAEKFLQDNRALFPAWQVNQANRTARQPGARISGIDRTQFNNNTPYALGCGIINPFI